MPDLHLGGDAVGHIQQVSGLDELIRPDDIDHGGIVGRRFGSHAGDDFVVDVIVADVFHDNFDIRVLGFKVTGDLIDLGRLQTGLIHGQDMDGHAARLAFGWQPAMLNAR